MTTIVTQPEIYPTSLDLDDARQMWRGRDANLEFIKWTRLFVFVILALGILTGLRMLDSWRAGKQPPLSYALALIVFAGITIYLTLMVRNAIREDKETMHALASGLSATDYQRITGCPHPWAVAAKENSRSRYVLGTTHQEGNRQ